MKVAILSDIHGFDLALAAVLADIAENPCDQIVFAGDLCMVGPAPSQTLEMIRATGGLVVQGNTDLELVECRPNTTDKELIYAKRHVNQEQLDWLAGLPFQIRITPPGGSSPKYDLLVVHATPWSLVDQIPPHGTPAQLDAVLGPVEAGVIAHGHVHVCGVREHRGIVLLNVSAVGNPKDGDLRCKYGVATWDETSRTWSAEVRSIEYPLEATEAQIMSSSLPSPRKAIRKLRRARYH